MDFTNLEELIELNRDEAVQFGNASCDLNPTADRVKETEERIGAKLPPVISGSLPIMGGGLW